MLGRETASGGLLFTGGPVLARRRTFRFAIVPPPVGQLFGYERESARLRAIVDRGMPAIVGIRGAGGSGKTEFLVRALRPEASRWPGGTVFVSARNLAAGDIIALVSEAVFAISDPRTRPSTRACGAALGTRRLLIGLDDIRSAQDLARIRATFAGSCICFTSERKYPSVADGWIELCGLETNEGIALLQEVAQPNCPEEDIAADVVTNLGGNPSRIRCAATMGVPFSAIAAACTSSDAFDELQLSLVQTRLSPNLRVLLAAAALFGDAALMDERAGAGLLAQGSFIEPSSVGWAVPEGLRRRLNQLEFDHVKAAGVLLNALRRVNGSLAKRRSLVECAAGLLTTMRHGGVPARAASELIAREVDRRGLWGLSGALYEELRASASSARDAAGTPAHRLGVPHPSAGSAHDPWVRALPHRRGNGPVRGRALTKAELAELGEDRPSSRETAGRRKVNAMLLGAGLAIAGCVVVLHSFVWSSIVARPQGHPARAAASTLGLAQARPRLVAGASSSVHSIVSQSAQRNVHASDRVQTSALDAVAGGSPQRRPTASPAQNASLPARVAVLKHRWHRWHFAPRVTRVVPPHISLLSMLPRKVLTGSVATLCVSADHSQRLFVTGLGALNPSLTTCRTVSPKKTTTFIAYAANARGQQAKATITVVMATPPT
jgi:hypothetical protein